MKKQETFEKLALKHPVDTVTPLIRNQKAVDLAGARYKELRGIIKDIKADGKEVIASAKGTYDLLRDKMKTVLAPYEQEATLLKAGVDKFVHTKQKAAIKAAEKKTAVKGTSKAVKELIVEQATVKAAVVEGMRVVRSWDYKEIDTSKVPAYIDGVEIRPIARGALLKIIRASNGKIKIPGIEVFLKQSSGL